MKQFTFIMQCLLAAATLSPAMAFADNGVQKFNEGWAFRLGDEAEALQPGFNDKDWQRLSLPHDWSIGLPFDKDAPAGNDGGYLPTGTGWYRKSLTIKPVDLGKKRQLYFEGVYINSDVYVNGQRAGGHPYGYSSFFVDLTPYLKEGDNSIAVRVDNSQQKNYRWYSGSGIFRNVRLKETGDTRIANWGIQIYTPSLDTAMVKTTVENESKETKSLEVTVDIDGVSKTSNVSLKPGERSVVKQDFSISTAKTWSPDSPNLYTADITAFQIRASRSEVSTAASSTSGTSSMSAVSFLSLKKLTHSLRTTR